eukprot:10077583-Heterocapsa_arctica.AAC.1
MVSGDGHGLDAARAFPNTNGRSGAPVLAHSVSNNNERPRSPVHEKASSPMSGRGVIVTGKHERVREAWALPQGAESTEHACTSTT